MRTARAFRIHQDATGHRAGIETLDIPDPAAGEVLVRVRYSSVNYKDALAGTGQGKILRRFPLTGGIDASGTVEVSANPEFKPGDAVIATGWGLSFDHDGGYADYLCVPGDWLTRLPPGLDLADSMTLGTAGLTAALAIDQMTRNDLEPSLGPILVTGASGGVGCIAVSMLARLGFEVAAVSGKSALHPWLRELGATQVLGRDELPGGERPLEKAVWGGAIDNVGGAMLARLTRTLVPNGCIASIGLAGGTELNTTVMPFILRGIKLLGCNSGDIRKLRRQRLWRRLATDWPADLARIRTQTIGLAELPTTFERLLAGELHGRVLVDLQAA
jgi:NADPH2:quinone reductase